MSRIITALIVLPVLVASILISWLAPLFVALALSSMVLGLYEFWLLARRRGIKPDVVAGFVGAAALFTVFYFDRPYEAPVLLLLILPALTIAALSAAMLRGAPFENMIASVGATMLGVMYVAFLGGHLVAVRMGFDQQRAAHLLSFLLLVIIGCDSGAY
jgi:CDP-diglyceride synthetase